MRDIVAASSNGKTRFMCANVFGEVYHVWQFCLTAAPPGQLPLQQIQRVANWFGGPLATAHCLMHYASRHSGCLQKVRMASGMASVCVRFGNQFMWPRYGVVD